MKNYIDKIPTDVLKIIEILNSYNYKAYLVGGCVRDILCDKIPHDYDICTTALPNEMINIFNKHNYKKHKKGIKYGTLTLICNDKEYEVTTLRSAEKVKKIGKEVDIKYTIDLKEDLSIRDFTINAMAIEIVNGQTILHDFFGGLEDLQNKVIRATCNPYERLETDAIRILRAIRFSITKEYHIEKETKQAMFDLKFGLENVSKERITEELYKILTSDKPIRKQFLQYREIIGVIIPELIPCFMFNQNNNHHAHDVYEHILYVVDYCDTNDFEIKLAALLHDIGKPKAYVEDDLGRGHFYGHPEDSYEICLELLDKRLKLSNKQKEMVLNLVHYHDMPITENKKKIKKILAIHGEEMFRKWLILKQADKDDHINITGWRYDCDLDNVKNILDIIIEEQSCFTISKMEISGKDLIALGMSPGKEIGEMLQKLLLLIIEEELQNDKETLIEKTKELLMLS